MNEHITTVGQAIAMEHTFIDEVGNPAQTSQESIRTYGRVCSETDARLNDKSLVLETTRQVGNGCRVALNVDKVPAFSMFPGQVLVGFAALNTFMRSYVHCNYVCRSWA